VLSILKAVLVKVAVLPATSVTVTVPVTAAPSAVSTNGLVAGVVLATPDRASAAVKRTETFVLFHPAALGAGVAGPKVSVGAVLSLLKAARVKLPVWPATSVTVTVPVTAAPSAVSTNGLVAGLVLATPDRASAAVKGTETFVLFHPAALGAGVAGPKVSVGAVLSILTVCEVNVAVLPATSVTVTVAVAPAVSSANVTGLAGLAVRSEERVSAAVNGIVTGVVLFHPAALGAGVVAPKLTVGGVLSILKAVLVKVDG